jgi:hypothetical protein
MIDLMNRLAILCGFAATLPHPGGHQGSGELAVLAWIQGASYHGYVGN